MNLLKRDLSFSIEVYPFGWLLCAPPCQSGIPMSAINDAFPLFPNGSMMDSGIAGALGGITAIGRPALLEKWRKQITEQLAVGGTPKELQWVRGVNCGLSSMALFRKLAGRDASCEAERRLHGRASNDTPKDASDFGRCVRMIEFCGWKDRLHEARGISPEWDAILDRWDSLCTLLQDGKLDVIEFP